MFVLTGMRAWVIQRFSAVVLLIVMPLLLVSLLQLEDTGHEGWRRWVVDGFNPIWIMGGFIALLLHCWVGIRDVLLDYVRQRMVRIVLLGGTVLVLFWLGLWMALILLSVM
ncbi:MAG: succinate dehydrogenase, hydrophobic membrane anchor protein [Gammaproteobacteria bacterium]|uniref:Succinate dehydrogenase hydrophobic membrane anchor subunit n=1 Tax=Candidatus Thiopontia autotrophica TaxID=2841688 RepID=A0A8J6P8S1_9GAMM|nr:succinate dehydrogenase, hydrophobic membrane anchor protein [Candidatus Thiopontia autotrophica]MBL6968961.1 succinate dehydrogenase, hydrophobic membrane anchor protein [Gammaproteobacteria bacterium]